MSIRTIGYLHKPKSWPPCQIRAVESSLFTGQDICERTKTLDLYFWIYVGPSIKIRTIDIIWNAKDSYGLKFLLLIPLRSQDINQKLGAVDLLLSKHLLCLHVMKDNLSVIYLFIFNCEIQKYNPNRWIS